MINTPARGIGKTTVDRLADYAAQHGLTLLEAARPRRQIDVAQQAGRGPVAASSSRCSTAWPRPPTGRSKRSSACVLSETGYQQQLQESDDEEDQQRLANIEELLTVAREFDERHGGDGQLEASWKRPCLVNDTDDWEAEADRVTLMTLHASKGLEFPVVFLVAVEEGLLPHERSREQPEQLEEERRLMFVGITRAQQELQLSLARYRDFRGQRKMTDPQSVPHGTAARGDGTRGAGIGRAFRGRAGVDRAGAFAPRPGIVRSGSASSARRRRGPHWPCI